MTASQQAPLKPARERLAIGALALGAFAMALNANVLAALMPFLARDPIYAAMDGGAVAAALGRLLGSAGVAGAVAALLLGPVVDRLGRRGPMLWGSVLFVLASAGHLLADSDGTLLLVRALAGFGSGLVFTSASAAVADLVPYERRGAAMGVFSAGMFLAIPLGLPLAVTLAEHGAWRAVFAVQAVVGLGALISFWVLIPAHLGRSEGSVSQLALLRRPMVLPALLSVMLHTGAFAVSIQFAGKWLDDSGILPRSQHAPLWIMLGLTTALGSLILPRLSDRTGKRNFVLITSAGVAICLLILSRIEDVRGLLLVGIPMTLLAAARTGPLQALMSEIVPARNRGTLMGIRSAAIQLGIGLFGFVAGSIYGASGYGRLLQVGVVAMVVSYFLIRLFVEEPPSQRELAR